MEKIFSLADIETIAAEAWNIGKGCKVWAFHAEMGAGKTTFIHALCNTLQVKDVVSSPTFAIINEYYSPVAGSMYHMDWYRLKDEEEAINAGVEDAVYSNKYCFIEWPEKAETLLPVNTTNIYLYTIDENTRRIVVEVKQ